MAALVVDMVQAMTAGEMKVMMTAATTLKTPPTAIVKMAAMAMTLVMLTTRVMVRALAAIIMEPEMDTVSHKVDMEVPEGVDEGEVLLVVTAVDEELLVVQVVAEVPGAAVEEPRVLTLTNNNRTKRKRYQGRCLVVC